MDDRRIAQYHDSLCHLKPMSLKVISNQDVFDTNVSKFIHPIFIRQTKI